MSLESFRKPFASITAAHRARRKELKRKWKMESAGGKAETERAIKMLASGPPARTALDRPRIESVERSRDGEWTIRIVGADKPFFALVTIKDRELAVAIQNTLDALHDAKVRATHDESLERTRQRQIIRAADLIDSAHDWVSAEARHMRDVASERQRVLECWRSRARRAEEQLRDLQELYTHLSERFWRLLRRRGE